MSMFSRITILLAILLFHKLIAQTPGGLLTGVVRDDAGGPVAGAKVIIQRLTDYVRDDRGHVAVKQLGLFQTITTADDGSYRLSGLPDGRYEVCAYANGNNKVSSCDWDGLPVVQLQNGAVLHVDRTLHDAAVVTVEVVDVNGRIAVPQSNGFVPPDRRFFVGVSAGPMHYLRAASVSHTNTSHIFTVSVPKRRTARLSIDSDLLVTNGDGLRIETKKPSSVEIPADAGPKYTIRLYIP